MTTGHDLIAEERRRQVDAEGWSADHDDRYDVGVLRRAAASYLLADRAITSAAQWVIEAQKLGEPYVTDAKKTEADPLGRYFGRDSSDNVNTPRGGEWPFDAEWWKPTNDPIRNLVKAGALIAAEIDIRLRAAERAKERT